MSDISSWSEDSLKVAIDKPQILEACQCFSYYMVCPYCFLNTNFRNTKNNNAHVNNYPTFDSDETFKSHYDSLHYMIEESLSEKDGSTIGENNNCNKSCRYYCRFCGRYSTSWMNHTAHLTVNNKCCKKPSFFKLFGKSYNCLLKNSKKQTCKFSTATISNIKSHLLSKHKTCLKDIHSDSMFNLIGNKRCFTQFKREENTITYASDNINNNSKKQKLNQFYSNININSPSQSQLKLGLNDRGQKSCQRMSEMQKFDTTNIFKTSDMNNSNNSNSSNFDFTLPTFNNYNENNEGNSLNKCTKTERLNPNVISHKVSLENNVNFNCNQNERLVTFILVKKDQF